MANGNLNFILFLKSDEKNNQSGDLSALYKLQSAVYSMTGNRFTMEDRLVMISCMIQTQLTFRIVSFVVEENINGSTGVSLFAIFDGHGGTYVADYAENVMTPSIFKKIVDAKSTAKNSSFHGNCNRNAFENVVASVKNFDGNCYVYNGSQIDYKALLADEILAADEVVVDESEIKGINVGSTALIALLDGSELIVANVGDSRGVMCDTDGKTVPLSFDHKPDGESEHKRIKQAGGFIAHFGVWRISGVLATSRALGNFKLKPQPLIADPDFLTFDLRVHK